MSATRYIIVVHGIGEQRKNETVLPVVSRFAEARRGLNVCKSDTVLSLGTATGQTGKQTSPGVCRAPQDRNPFRPWLEFKGIPQPGGAAPTAEFLGEWDDSGDNLRFVDLWWADVMQDDIGDVGQPPEKWTEAMLTRLERKATVAPWVLALLGELCSVVKGLSLIMRLRAKDLGDMIFTKFLGDVQLYGEYAHCRGQAVRRFHRLMARIEAEHNQRGGGEARYTIVAHSLGSIMSFDALLYAHATESVRGKIVRGGPNLPFPNYAREKDFEGGVLKTVKKGERDMYNVDWKDRVDSFVTLGSPIDKYLILWWLNYTYLNDTQWMDERTASKIQHLNYCDEQDPVGHNLDVAQGTAAYKAVFERKEDVVFNRYATPLVAHVKYWRDLDLFKWILAKAVDAPAKVATKCAQPTWFDNGKYTAALAYTYGIVPLLVGVAMFFTATWAVDAEGWHGTAIALMTMLVVAWLGRSLIRLFVWWRQIAREKWRTAVPGATNTRKRRAMLFRINLAALQMVLAAATGLFFAFAWRLGIQTAGQTFAVLGLLLLVGGGMAFAGLLRLFKGTGRPGADGGDFFFAAAGALGVFVGVQAWEKMPAQGEAPLTALGKWFRDMSPNLILTVFVAVAIAAAIVTYVRWTMLASKRYLAVSAMPPYAEYCGEKAGRSNPTD